MKYCFGMLFTIWMLLATILKGRSVTTDIPAMDEFFANVDWGNTLTSDKISKNWAILYIRSPK